MSDECAQIPLPVRPRVVTMFGQRLRVHHYDAASDIVWVYGWRDVLARPVAGALLASN